VPPLCEFVACSNPTRFSGAPVPGWSLTRMFSFRHVAYKSEQHAPVLASEHGHRVHVAGIHFPIFSTGSQVLFSLVCSLAFTGCLMLHTSAHFTVDHFTAGLFGCRCMQVGCLISGSRFQQFALPPHSPPAGPRSPSTVTSHPGTTAISPLPWKGRRSAHREGERGGGVPFVLFAGSLKDALQRIPAAFYVTTVTLPCRVCVQGPSYAAGALLSSCVVHARLVFCYV
jgi:hypothetical protein